MKFYIVDAFTETLFGGNPAGVVILEKGADFPDDELMRKTATELRYSETAFIRQLEKNAFQIRYFTPAAEVDLCGHATIGSFYALADAGLVVFESRCICDTHAGRLNIILSEEAVFMDMSTPKAIGKITEEASLRELYNIMGTTEVHQVEISSGEHAGRLLYPELISTGLPDILMPVSSIEALHALAPDFAGLSLLSEKYQVVGVHAFTINAQDGAVHCRNFAPLYDIDEEAATGTSNGALTYYLYKNGLLPHGNQVRFIQGEAMNRPSVITGILNVENGEAKIQIGGSAVILASGEINLQ